MDEVLLTASQVALLCTGLGGALAVLFASVRRVRGRGWVPVVAVVLMLVMLAMPGQPFDAPILVTTLLLVPWFVGFPLLAATFPDGRFVPRWSVWPVVVSALVLVVNALTGDAWRRSDGWVWFAVAQMGAAGFIVYRYRRSATTSERESVRWVLLGLIVTVSVFALLQLIDGVIGGRAGADDPLGLAKANLAGIPLMLGLVIALTRPRLINVDAAFRVVLVLLLSGFTMIGVIAAGEAVGAHGGTVVVAVLAYPIVRVALRVATWLVHRSRLDPATAAARLAEQLDADDPRPVAQRVVDVAAAAIGSPWVRIAAASATDAEIFGATSETPGVGSRPDEDSGSGSEPGSGSDPLPGSFPITFRGELLAALTAAPRAGESEPSATDRAVLATLARHAAPALHGARALQEATAAQRALVTAQEEERRRLRRELHDDLGPALSGLALGAAAVARRAARVDPALAEAAEELQSDIRDAVERSRQISHGLRPPVLDDRGLASALEDRLGDSGDVELDVGRLGALPAAVDLAVLRIVQEAVTNARRHAAASLCRVRVHRDGSGLHVEVADDGVGIPRAVVAGMGLRSIRERAAELGGRARVVRGRSGGTVVRVWLPVDEGSVADERIPEATA